MKILIISLELWREDINGGNVLSNLFSGIDAEFAQIYCSAGEPQNNVCKLYYQMTDRMIIKNIIEKKEIGNIIKYDEFPKNSIHSNIEVDKTDLKKNKILRMFKGSSMYAVREILWKSSKWKNDNLEKFILDFNPDIIFAPCYGSHIMLSINRYVSELTKVPMISYISDDSYSLKQVSFSPVYWINRFILRSNLRKTMPYYELTYTMAEEQLKEYSEALNCNMKILKKSGIFSEYPINKEVNTPIRLVYAGGIYLGRWKTLSKIVEALKAINKDSIKMVLDIYTGNELNKKQKKLLNDGINSFVHKPVSQQELKKIYCKSDIALHVESFDLKNKLKVRLSFSTKIIDCLESTCAIMAICDKGQAGYSYLKEEDIAICIDNLNNIESRLRYICENPYIINEYSEKARLCGINNHQKEIIQQNIVMDFKMYMEDANYENSTC